MKPNINSARCAPGLEFSPPEILNPQLKASQCKILGALGKFGKTIKRGPFVLLGALPFCPNLKRSLWGIQPKAKRGPQLPKSQLNPLGPPISNQKLQIFGLGEINPSLNSRNLFPTQRKLGKMPLSPLLPFKKRLLIGFPNFCPWKLSEIQNSRLEKPSKGNLSGKSLESFPTTGKTAGIKTNVQWGFLGKNPMEDFNSPLYSHPLFQKVSKYPYFQILSLPEQFYQEAQG